ncbi:MAG: hypothetical protein ABSB79_10745 [Syntrophales bacterium]
MTISNARIGFTVGIEYDASGMRVAKHVCNGMETLYTLAHYDYEEKGGVATKYIFANGTRIANVKSH